MAFQALLLVAIGLSMDAFGASISRGALVGQHRLSIALWVASLFGCFAAVTPLVGWAIGIALLDLISALDHWIAFGLLSAVGTKMIFDAWSHRDSVAANTGLRILILLVSAIATNVDAGIFGITLPLMQVNLLVASATIGIVTFTASFVGLYIGRVSGAALGHKAEIFGGVILIMIGTKILIDHTYLAN